MSETHRDRDRPARQEVARASLPEIAEATPVAVVIPALQAAPVIGRAVASALAQPQVARVVVAAGDAETRQAAERIDDPRLEVVDNPSGRTPDGLNLAIDRTTEQVVARLDAHAVLPAGYVPVAVGVLARTGAANVGGRQVPTADAGFARAVALAMRSPVGAGGAAYRTGGQPGPVDTVYLGVFRREALEAVGGFDPRFVRNQDAELNLRLTRAGYQVWFEPSLAVTYRPRGTVRGLAHQYLQYGRFRRLTARVHAGSLRPRQLAAPVLVLGCTMLAVLAVAIGAPLVLLLPAVAYLMLLLMAGFQASRRPQLVMGVALALLVMHVSWGLGFLVGPPRGVAGPG